MSKNKTLPAAKSASNAVVGVGGRIRRDRRIRHLAAAVVRKHVAIAQNRAMQVVIAIRIARDGIGRALRRRQRLVLAH